MLRNWPVASQQDRDRCRQCALLPAGRGTVMIAAARLLRCRRAQHFRVTTGSAAEGAGDAPLASPGARWTREEDEELVAAVRAGADLVVIAELHGRTRSAIVSRLLRMIPARAAIPEEEQLGWITARLADPCFDWRTPLAHPRPGRRGEYGGQFLLVRGHLARVERLHGPVQELSRARTVPVSPSLMKVERCLALGRGRRWRSCRRLSHRWVERHAAEPDHDPFHVVGSSCWAWRAGSALGVWGSLRGSGKPRLV